MMFELEDIQESNQNVCGTLLGYDRDRKFHGNEQVFLQILRSRSCSDVSDRSCRIDYQGKIKDNETGRSFANIQMQSGSQSFAQILIPIGMNIGTRNIRNLLSKSLETGQRVVLDERPISDVYNQLRSDQDRQRVSRHGQNGQNRIWAAVRVYNEQDVRRFILEFLRLFFSPPNKRRNPRDEL